MVGAFVLTSTSYIDDWFVAGFDMKPSCTQQLRYPKGMSSVGYAYGLLKLTGKIGGKFGIFTESTFSEAAAIPCPGRDGRIIYQGFYSKSSSARTAVRLAYHYVKRCMSELEEFLGKPRIDLVRLVRLREDGSVMKDGAVDIALYIPEHVSAAYLAPSMVMALVFMLWRLPPRTRWSFVGGFAYSGRLSGYPNLGKSYIDRASKSDYEVLVLPKADARKVVQAARDHGFLPEHKGLRVVGCEFMMEAIKAATVGHFPPEVE